MPRDINGVYTLPAGNPAQPRTLTITNVYNTTLADIVLALNGIPGGALAPGSVGETQLADNAVTNAKMADNAVGTAELVDSSITPPKLVGMGSNGLVTRVGASSFAESVITGTANQIAVTNGDGVADHPTIGLATNPTLPGVVTLGGGQLVFPATQSPSADPNTLDDYEEGTFTPVLSFVTPGNSVIAYAAQTGNYTKIGNVVYVRLTIQTSTFTHTTASGALRITGLPFTSASGQHALSSFARGVTWASNFFHPVAMVNGSSVVDLYLIGGPIGTTATVSVLIDETRHVTGEEARFFISGCYRV